MCVFLFSLSCVIFVLWEADSRFRVNIAENYPGRAGKTRREKWESIYTLITFRVVQQKFSSSSVRPNLDVLYKSFEYTILACEI